MVVRESKNMHNLGQPMSLMRIGNIFVAAICLNALVGVLNAEAAVPDQSCSEVGSTAVSEDQHEILACLENGSHNLVWTELASKARPLSNISPAGTADVAPASNFTHKHWQGWYIGGDAGVADTVSSYDQVISGLSTFGTTNLHALGGTAGLVGGYNWTRSDGLFYGGELDINYLGSSANASAAPAESVWKGYASARGRLGIAFDPALVFLSAGLALVDVDNKRNGFVSYSNDQIHVGWTAGAGTEFSLTDKMSMSVQYLFLGMPQNTQSYSDNSGTKMKDLIDNSANVLRVGINWHF